MQDEYFRRQIYPLRLPPTMRHRANELARREGISMNQFISLAVAEKISRMETAALDAAPANSPEKNPARRISVPFPPN